MVSRPAEGPPPPATKRAILDTLLRYGLIAVFLALILTPFGLPIPEDITLIGSGTLVRMGNAQLVHALFVGYLGVMVGDTISFTMGRRVGLHPTGLISRLVGPEDIERIERFYQRWGSFAIVIARQFPGMRLPAFFFAGASGLSFGRFLLFDGTAALVTVGLYTWLGYTFSDDLGRLLATVDRFRSVVGVAVGTLLVLAIGRILWRLRVRRQGESSP